MPYTETGSSQHRSRGPRLIVGASIGLFAVVVALTGCAPSTTASAPTSSPVTVSSTPAPIVAPAVAFNGDCNSVLSADTVKAVSGATLTLQASGLKQWPEGGGNGASETIAMRGGAQCEWADSTGQLPRLTVIALSQKSGVSPTPQATVCTQPSSVGTVGAVVSCSGSLTSNGYWIAWNLDQLVHVSQALATAKANALVTELQASAAQAGTAPTFTQPAGSMDGAADCAALASGSGLPGVLAVKGMVTNSTSGGDEPAVTANEVYAAGNAADKAVGVSSCSWAQQPFEGDGSSQPAFTVTVYPGAAWYLATFRSAIDAKPASIPGVSGAIEVSPEQGEDFQRIGSEIALAHGADLVLVHWQNLDFTSQGAVIPKVLAALHAA